MDWAYELFKRFKKGALAGIPLIGGFLAEGFDLYCKSQEERGTPDINAIAGQLAVLQRRCDRGEAVIEGLTGMLAGGEVDEEFREPLEELVEAVNSADGPDKLPPRFQGALEKIEKRFGSGKEFEDHCAEKFEQILAGLVELKEGQDGLADDHGRIEAKIDRLSDVGRRPRRGDRLCNLAPRNEAFTGRGEELDELHAALESGRPVAILRDLSGLDEAAVRQVIKGLGGVGKTQLAVEYGHCHADEYAIRWLIRAETPSDARLSLVELGRELEPELAKVADVDQQVKHTLQLLNNADSALLIYDNVERPEDIAGLYPTAAGHVLITSRYTDWQNIARPISLETFTEAEALEYLHRRELTDDKEDLKALAQRLGYLPLGLAMAAGYMARQRVSAGEYLGEYESDRAVLTDAPLPQDYRQADTLPAVFERSFAAAGKQEPLAMELLESLAFLAPDDIPLFVLDYPDDYPREHVSGELAAALVDERRRRELVSVLVDYSLVTRADDTLSIHRLTRDVLDHRLAADEALRERRLHTAIELVNAQVVGDPTTDVEQWPILDALAPHIRMLREAMANVPPVDCREPWPRVLNQFGLYCQTRAEYAEAKACFERALVVYEATLGPGHPDVATCASNLGNVLREMGDLAEAKECIERALRIDEAAYGADHPNVAIRLSSLGLVLKDMGDVARAKERLERALEIDEAACGPDHPRVAIRVNNLGLVLSDMGDKAGAKAYYERALRIDEAAYGPDHPEVAAALNNLGGVLGDMGDKTAQKDCYERALKIDEAAYGPDHPNVAIAVNNLGSVLRAMGDLGGGKQCFERALKIGKATLGPDHPNVGSAVNNLGGVLEDMGDLAGAKACYERALKIDEAAYGPGHPDVATDLNNLGGVLVELGKFAEARPHLERAVAIFTDKLGPEHPSTQTAMGWLERVRREMA